ncbi:hypothetical protein FQN54_007886 [Arachnomyces sp. PD_36]|nr:hypothetical protein FQN54_007886 [Arachnomyces sp. PD_36]
MPVTPSFQQPTASAQSKMAQSRSSSNTSRTEDSGSGAEAPGRRRVQKAPPSAKQTNNPEQRTTLATRRRMSVRDQKAPLGPRPRENSPSKRTTSNTSNTYVHSLNSSVDSTNEAARNYGIRNNSQSTRAPGSARSSTNEENQTPTDSNEFLTPINFDDFHNSIMSREPSLSHFPLPGHGGNSYETNPSAQKPTPQTTRTTRSGSLLQRQNSVSRSLNQPTSSMGPPPPPSGARARRQSNVPAPSSNVASSRPPRKSMGPGIMTYDATNTAARRRPSFARNNGTEGQRPEQGANLGVTNYSDSGSNGDNSLKLDTQRVLKAKSLQPPTREPREQLLTPSNGSDHSRSSSINAFRTPGKTAGDEVGTPTSSKRMSTVPHATGLGARTISPTDARRMKRLSMMPQPPPLPHTPPMQTERVPSRPRSSAQSPSLIPRKSVTPSSSRTTPDPHRKSYSSGISLSSTTSYNSVRNSNGSLQPRFSQSISSSRLPTPKPRTENSTSCDEEEVPPVPAIPKAYESPKEDHHLGSSPFISRKSSLPQEVGQISASPKPSSESSGNAVSSVPDDTQYGSESRDANAKAKQAANVSKKNLQPLKLPPLNLLPLSTPMAAKIDALRDKEPSMQDAKSFTPPPRQMNAKTPTTPMTASKASFFPQGQDSLFSTQMRSSSSSQFAIPPETSAPRAPSSSSVAGPFDAASRYKMNSPYVSSLPKNSGDYNEMAHKASGEYTRSVPVKPTGPRPHTQSSTIWSSAESQRPLRSPVGADSVLPASTLKQKLSMYRKRSNSISQVGAETEPDPAKYDNMPPPRLPASATWSNLNSRASPNSKPSYLKTRAKPPTSVITNGSIPKSLQPGQEQTPGADSRTSLDSSELELQPSKSTSSLLSPVHKILGTSRSTPSPRLRPQDAKLDADDMKAEEEMRKLGSKRKDFETAAKGLDELRRRASPKERVAPAQALKMASLNIFEKGEIIDFKDVYFCGTQKAKKHVGDLNSTAANFGYDDDRGDYNIVLGDHLAYRYEIIDVLGKGSFGQVVRCIDHRTGALVAVKIIRNKKRFHQQALVEVDILQKLKEWDPDRRHSVINFTQSFYFRGHLCISTELLGINLYEFIKAHDFRGFSLKLIRRFTKQLLSTLVLLHSRKVIHCDMKPENILLAHPMHSEIRVIDFGSSCFENEKVYTYIQSRFYRSPEVILGMSYGMPIDMWSLGCILAELYTGYPIFPGENEQEQLACIMEVFGPPEKHLIEKSTRKKLFFDSLGKPRLTVSSKGRRRRPSSKDLRQALKCDDEAFLDFITRCLRWDPARRLNPNDALNHEFITGVKMSSRARSHLAPVHSSPGKRMSTAHVSSSARPLPDPPASMKPGIGARSKEMTSSSPVKGGPMKRHSTVNGLQSSNAVGGAKRTSNTSLTGSALPRVTTRSASGKPDLAAAAAATSLTQKTR